jgi:hypothetical protein
MLHIINDLAIDTYSISDGLATWNLPYPLNWQLIVWLPFLQAFRRQPISSILVTWTPTSYYHVFKPMAWTNCQLKNHTSFWRIYCDHRLEMQKVLIVFYLGLPLKWTCLLAKPKLPANCCQKQYDKVKVHIQSVVFDKLYYNSEVMCMSI